MKRDVTKESSTPILNEGCEAPLAKALHELRTGALKVFVSNWLALILRAATTILIVRVSGAEAKGVQTYVVAYAAIGAIIFGLGMPTGVSYWLNSGSIPTKMLRRRCVWHCVIVAAFLLVFHRVMIGILPDLNSPSISDFALGCWTLAMTPLLLLNDLTNNLALAKGRVKNYSLQINGESIAFGISLVVFALLKMLTPITVVVSSFIGYVAAAFIGFIGLRDAFNEPEKLEKKPDSLWGMYQYAFHGYPGVFVNGIQRRLDVLIIGPLLGTKELAYYSVGAQGFQALMSLPRALTGLLTRSICRAHEGDAHVLAMSVTRKVLLYMGGIAIPLSVFGYWAIPLMYGPAFKAAVLPFALLVWAAVFTGGVTCLQSLCSGRGKQGWVSMAIIFVAIVKVLLLMWLVAPYGISGSAAATLLSSVFGFGLQWMQSRKFEITNPKFMKSAEAKA